MDAFFQNHLASIGWAAYLLIFFLMFFEGDALIFLSVYLTNQGYLELEILVPVIFAAAVVGDSLWFKFGGYLERRSPFVHKWFGKATTPINDRLARKPKTTLFLSKFMYGLNRVTMVRAGAISMRYKTFLKTDMFTIICWISLIGGIAFFTSVSLDLFRHYFKYAQFTILGVIVLLYVFMHFMSKIHHHVIADSLEDSL